MKNKSAQISMIVCTMIAALLVGIVGLQFMKPSQALPDTQVVGDFGGPFQLTDTHGKPFSSQSLGDQYRLIYFGFTTCPAICPTELAKMTDALRSIAGHKIAQKIQPIFITIDPARDTVPVMKDYLTNFHESFIGLTGSQAEIDRVLSAYKVYAAKVKDPNASEYTMDHSSYIFLTDSKDQLIKIYKMADPAQAIADDLVERLK